MRVKDAVDIVWREIYNYDESIDIVNYSDSEIVFDYREDGDLYWEVLAYDDGEFRGLVVNATNLTARGSHVYAYVSALDTEFYGIYDMIDYLKSQEVSDIIDRQFTEKFWAITKREIEKEGK